MVLYLIGCVSNGDIGVIGSTYSGVVQYCVGNGDIGVIGSTYSGVVQYCISGEWIGVCGTEWTNAMSERVCRQVLGSIIVRAL